MCNSYYPGMAKPHWRVVTTDPDTGATTDHGYGCQYTPCQSVATNGWQRASTEPEITAESETTGPYGDVYRNTSGPHSTAVFACASHALSTDYMSVVHHYDCPAPDPGCVCE